VGQIDKLLTRDGPIGATELRLCLRSGDETKSDRNGGKHAQTGTSEPRVTHHFSPQRSEQKLKVNR
jgi:hypothetical protein